MTIFCLRVPIPFPLNERVISPYDQINQFRDSWRMFYDLIKYDELNIRKLTCIKWLSKKYLFLPEILVTQLTN